MRSCDTRGCHVTPFMRFGNTFMRFGDILGCHETSFMRLGGSFLSSGDIRRCHAISLLRSGDLIREVLRHPWMSRNAIHEVREHVHEVRRHLQMSRKLVHEGEVREFVLWLVELICEPGVYISEPGVD